MLEQNERWPGMAARKGGRRQRSAGPGAARRRRGARPIGNARALPAPAAARKEQRTSEDRRIPGFDIAALAALGLSRREMAVLELVAEGRTNEEVGRVLHVSPLTAKKHLERMYMKLGVSNRASLVAVAWQRSVQGRRRGG